MIDDTLVCVYCRTTMPESEALTFSCERMSVACEDCYYDHAIRCVECGGE